MGHHHHQVFDAGAGTSSTSICTLKVAGLTLYLIEMPYKAFANRADPDQGLLCLLNEK